MIKRNLLDYACFQISRFESVYRKNLDVEFLHLDSSCSLGLRGAYWVDTKSGTRNILLPNTNDKEDFDCILYHEIGHVLFQMKCIPKYVLRLLDRCQHRSSIGYYLKTVFVQFTRRTRGFCSNYSYVDAEEEFCELLSFVMINKDRIRHYYFDGEVIDLDKDYKLKKKVNGIRRFLKMDVLV